MMMAYITPPQDNVFLTLFGIDIMWYGVIIGIGILLGVTLATKEAVRYGLDEDHFTSMLLWAIPIAIVGARLYYVLFNLDYYTQNPGQIINIRQGGLAIYGGIIAALITAYIYCKKKNMNFLTATDAAMPGVALGQAIGRWGNFVNQEAYGGPTDLPWGMLIDGEIVHPTFLYESLFNGALVLFLLWYGRKKRKHPGEVLFLYMIGYGIARLFIEGLRTDSLYLGVFRVSQLVSIGGIVLGIVGLWALRQKKEQKNGSKKKRRKN